MPRRTRSPHPGVVLVPPSGRHVTWRAQYTDPDSDRVLKERLDPVALRTAEVRRDWAIRKSKALAKRRLELEGGAPRATGTSIDATVKSYFEAHPQLRQKTRTTYEAAAKKLTAWATKEGLESADDLNRARLMGFREALIREPRRAAKPKGKRGERVDTERRRSAHSVNRELRAVGSILRYLCDKDKFVRLTHDDLRRALKRLDAPIERITFCKPRELQKLLAAALEHDAATFAETRAEHAGERPKGSTMRYEAIAPFVACAALSGMRLGELVSLEWRQVDIDAADHDGNIAGEIHLTGATGKTKKARTVDLSVSPALRTLLAAMHEKSGGKGSVFGITADGADAAAARLVRDFGAPAGCGWQALRRTCGTFLTNAGGIFGAASAYRSAKQLGHSVAIAERHYVGLIRISNEAKTLEAAMQINDQLSAVVERVHGNGDARLTSTPR